MPRRVPQAELSRIISKLWADEDESTKKKYEQLAIQEKLKHAGAHPTYQYCPKSREVRLQLAQQKKEAAALARLEKRRSRHAPYTTAPHRGIKRALTEPVSMSPEQADRHGAHGPSPPMSGASTPERVPSPPIASTSQLLLPITPETIRPVPASVPNFTPETPALTPTSGPPSAAAGPASAASHFATMWTSPISPLSQDEGKTGPLTGAQPFTLKEDMVRVLTSFATPG